MRGIPINKNTNSFNRKTDCAEWEINTLETFFKSIKMPILPIKVNEFEVITDVEKFISTHLEYAKNNNGVSTFKVYYERLLELKLILENNL